MALRESESNYKQKIMVLSDHDQSSSNLTKSSLTIVKHLFSKQEYSENNIVFSPLALQVVLGIIAAGSDGPTQQQLLDLLRFESTVNLNSYVSHILSFLLKYTAPWCPKSSPPKSSRKKSSRPKSAPSHPKSDFDDILDDIPKENIITTPTSLSFTNGVWVEETLSLQTPFKKILLSDYKASLSRVDFINNAIEVTKEVNLWAEKKTNGLIEEILPQNSVDNLTRLIFANALYFKGAWLISFPEFRTRDCDFHLLNGDSIQVPFMSSNLDQFIGEFDNFKVLCLPYKSGNDKRDFSMYIFLPNAKDGLPDFIENMTSTFELLEHNLPLKRRKLERFRIPKFKFSFGLETSHMLKELGVILPFSSGGLTKMVDSLEDQNFFVSNIFQKSFIEVNEVGTVAVAFNWGIHASCLPRGIDFVADHPFLFLIREDSTGTILFVGQVLNPLAEGDN